ncbi:hypothetical protein PVAND_015806 [Polypedilum vanderplanki]|uniref:Uncharacterized protein n=1 Tax=Polypedilum vanderplanki TaxID=319348 RepID=A0A9J6BDL1_POLVA|nr:hypothetical protein PVAND_015806 [Polypedilum vanderplanki]
MRFFTAFLVISLAVLSSADQGIVLRSVNNYKTYDFGRQYSAIVYKLNILGGDCFVQNIETTNVQGMTNDQVEAIHIVHQNVRYLPHRVLDWFKNVVHFHIIDSGLETLDGEPLDGRIRYVHLDDNRIKIVPRGFFANTGNMELISMERNMIESLDDQLFRGMSKLRWISFAGNRIKRLPGTLFVGTPNLECISFENNGLTNVGAELVRDLTKLKGVSFDGNVCINIAYWNEPTMRVELGKEFTTNCGGRCDGIDQFQKDIYNLSDKIEMMEEEKPMCSWFKNYYMSSTPMDSHSHSSEESNEDYDMDKKQKYGPNHACPYAHYQPMGNSASKFSRRF